MRTLKVTALALALVACGGSVDAPDASSPSNLPDCPANGTACSSGAKCNAVFQRTCSGGSFFRDCECTGPTWQCPLPAVPPCDDGGPPPIRETCGFAGAVSDGEPCYPDEKGRSCKRFGDGCILDETCTCDGTRFVCGDGPPLSCDGGAPDAGSDAPSDASGGG